MPVVGGFLKDKPEDLELLPDGAMHAETTAPDQASDVGLSWRDASHGKPFWIVVCALFLVGVSVQGCIVHLTAMLNDRGIPIRATTVASSLLGAAVLIGRVGSGYLLDRFFAPYLTALFFGGIAVGLVCFGRAVQQLLRLWAHSSLGWAWAQK